MKNRFKKLFLGLLLIAGVAGLSSCQSAERNATIPTTECEVRIVEDAHSGKRTAVITLGIVNNTIYNVLEEQLTYTVYNDDMPLPGYIDITETVKFPIRHGAQGYISYTYELPPEAPECDYVKITKTSISKYATLFQTYAVPFVIMFVFAGIAIVFFAIDLFRGGLTKESIKERFKERIASSVTIMALLLIIFLIPLMFSSWVTTLILVGGFVGTGVVCGLLTLLRLAFNKD